MGMFDPKLGVEARPVDIQPSGAVPSLVENLTKIGSTAVEVSMLSTKNAALADLETFYSTIASQRGTGEISAARAQAEVNKKLQEYGSKHPYFLEEFRKSAANYFGNFGPAQDLLNQTEGEKLQATLSAELAKAMQNNGLDPSNQDHIAVWKSARQQAFILDATKARLDQNKTSIEEQAQALAPDIRAESAMLGTQRLQWFYTTFGGKQDLSPEDLSNAKQSFLDWGVKRKQEINTRYANLPANVLSDLLKQVDDDVAGMGQLADTKDGGKLLAAMSDYNIQKVVTKATGNPSVANTLAFIKLVGGVENLQALLNIEKDPQLANILAKTTGDSGISQVFSREVFKELATATAGFSTGVPTASTINDWASASVLATAANSTKPDPALENKIENAAIYLADTGKAHLVPPTVAATLPTVMAAGANQLADHSAAITRQAIPNIQFGRQGNKLVVYKAVTTSPGEKGLKLLSDSEVRGLPIYKNLTAINKIAAQFYEADHTKDMDAYLTAVIDEFNKASTISNAGGDPTIGIVAAWRRFFNQFGDYAVSKGSPSYTHTFTPEGVVTPAIATLPVIPEQAPVAPAPTSQEAAIIAVDEEGNLIQ